MDTPKNRHYHMRISTGLLLMASLGITTSLLEEVFSPAPAVALTCKKGKPCGKACIPQNSVCQLNNPSGSTSGSSSRTIFPVSPTSVSSPKPQINYVRNNGSNCQVFARQGTTAPVGMSFNDSLGRNVVIRSREELKGGISRVTLAYQGSGNEVLHIRYNRQDWGKYLAGETNQAKYRTSAEVKPTKWRDQVEKDCNGRSSYTASLIRQLGY